MAPDPSIMKAVEQLGYRVTVGDIAAQAGLDVNFAQQGLLALATDAGGNLQVAESGEIAYVFPRDFRTILRNKFLRIRLQEWWQKVWRVLFYLIRISFGILLILSIVLIFVAIALIVIAASTARGDDRDSDRFPGGGMIFVPRLWFGPDIFWFFNPNPYRHTAAETPQGRKSEMNFLEAIFSFLFGDGNPNANLEERRWQTIGTVIRNNQGAVVAEQIAPYLDVAPAHDVDENYMLPVLTQFDGRPEVTPQGEIVYHFPALQTTAAQRRQQPVAAYFREQLWHFSRAGSGQLIFAVGLGAVNLIGALVLGNLLGDGVVAAQLGGFVAFVQSIFWLLVAYGVGFLAIPLGRYFWIQWRNQKIEQRNEQRQAAAIALNEAGPAVQNKIDYAQQFASEAIVTQDNLAYTTEKDLIEQELERSDQIDAEWQRRLDQSGPSGV